MTGMTPLMTRIGIGKLVGFAVGGTFALALPLIAPDTGAMMRWGIVLWYTTLGAIIGVFGVVTYHPVLRLPMPWYVRAPLLGAWLNFVLVLIAREPLAAVTAVAVGAPLSPFWLVAEGAAVGLLIGFCATRAGGEGAALAEGAPG